MPRARFVHQAVQATRIEPFDPEPYRPLADPQLRRNRGHRAALTGLPDNPRPLNPSDRFRPRTNETLQRRTLVVGDRTQSQHLEHPLEETLNPITYLADAPLRYSRSRFEPLRV
jgi:hypothetical protein